MNLKKLIFIFTLISALVISILGPFLISQATVQEAEQKLFDYTRYLYQLLLGLAAVAALVSLVIGGIIYMTSDTISSKESAKEYIKSAIIGLILALGAYLILYTINPDLVNWPSIESGNGRGGGNNNGGGGNNNGGGGLSAEEKAVRDRLAEKNINVNHGPCQANELSGCTNLAGVKPEVIEVLMVFQDEYGRPIMINAGSESDRHNPRGEITHQNGYKLDLNRSNDLDNYIYNPNNSQSAGNRPSDNAPIYIYTTTDGQKIEFAQEPTHWDISWEFTPQ